MEINDYQKKAMNTCMPTSNNIVYMSLNLSGEVGELCSKLAKAVRKGKLHINTEPLNDDGDRLHIHDLNVSEEDLNDIKKECGDVMWQIAGVCTVLGFSLDDVCQQNLDKLAGRKNRGVIDGNGDNR